MIFMNQKPSRKRVPEEERKRIAQRASEIGAAKTAIEFKRSVPFVYKCCAENNILPRLRGGNVRFRILKLILDGKTDKEIADEISVTRQYAYCIRTEARAAGFDI